MMSNLAEKFKDTPKKCLKSLHLPLLKQENSGNLTEINTKV